MVKKKEAYPVQNVDSMGFEMEVEIRTTTNELQSNNAIAKDVCFFRQLPSHCILWCQIATAQPGKESLRNFGHRNQNQSFNTSKWKVRVNLRSSSNTGADMGVIFREDSSQAKVCDFRIQVFVQENVACFDVTMHDTCVTSFMQVRQTSRCSFKNLHPCSPVHHVSHWCICNEQT